jgi:hypothetical protein
MFYLILCVKHRYKQNNGILINISFIFLKFNLCRNQNLQSRTIRIIRQSPCLDSFAIYVDILKQNTKYYCFMHQMCFYLLFVILFWYH